MKKILITMLAVCGIAFLGGCTPSEQPEVVESTGAVQQQSAEETLTWEFIERIDNTVQTGDVLRIFKNFDDLNVQERSFAFIHDAGVKSRVAGFGYEVAARSVSGDSFLEIQHDGDLSTYNGKNANTMEDTLGISMNVAGVYGPFQNVFASGVYALYTLLSPYGGSLEQHILDLDALKEVGFAEYFLYHNKDNTKLFATMLEEPGALTMYKDLVVFAENNKQTLLSGGLDGFAYDGYYLYAYHLAQNEDSTLRVVDTSNGEILYTLQNIGIGHEGKFILQGNILYASYGMVDFVREETYEQVMAYDLSKQSVLWKVQLQ